MSLALSHCVPDDIPELARASLAIWSRVPRQQVTFGNVPEPAMLEYLENDFREGMTSPKHYQYPQEKHYLKVTDTATNAIAAYGVWIYLPQGYHAEEDDEVIVHPLPKGSNEDLMREFCRMTGVLRSEHPGRKEAHWLLWLLATHPDHERKGAGSQLIQWPFSKADAAGVRCYVDASRIGHPLYRKLGFEDVGKMEVDLDRYEGGEGLGLQKWVAMVREPRKEIRTKCMDIV